ncbi:MAG: hypothetical protein HYY15_03730 [Candidatus Omnitrophica bacterium]|nr:hypothetical protein [Candidatus Omnitrophota bacterium]
MFRFPLEIVQGAIRIGWWLPQLPRVSAEHGALRRQLAADQLELARLREALRHASATAALTSSELPGALVGSVMGRTLLPTQQSILINRGERDGVKAGSLLMSSEGLVGRVIETTPATSLGLLVTDSDSRVAALTERTRETGLLVGMAGSWCQFIYVDPEADIVVGDRVVTAGLDGAFPKGLPVGTVDQVVRHGGGTSLSVRVRPAAMLRRIEEVLIIPPG